MYGKELFQKGIYGIVDLDTNKIVYVGSTNSSFAYRWNFHYKDFIEKKHCNKNLVKLFKSGNFKFIIIEAGNFIKQELLFKEKFYTEKYDAYENGYCLHVGGGKLIPLFTSKNSVYKEDNNILSIRNYIITNWVNIKIFKEDKIIIEKYLTDNGIRINKFMVEIRRLGFIIQRFADKKSWIITDKNF